MAMANSSENIIVSTLDCFGQNNCLLDMVNKQATCLQPNLLVIRHLLHCLALVLSGDLIAVQMRIFVFSIFLPWRLRM